MVGWELGGMGLTLFVLGYSQEPFNAKKAVKNCCLNTGHPMTTKPEKRIATFICMKL